MFISLRNTKLAHFYLLTSLIVFCSGGAAWSWPEDDVAVGQHNHPLILKQQGGEIRNQELVAYVRSVGERVIRHTELSNEPWTFTVTDTPTVNAFASPGGYIYVTRGLLAVANSEAELAAVIGHEAAHLTAAHHEKREERDNRAGIGVLIGTILGGILGGEDGLKKGIEFSSKVARGYVGSFSQKQEFEADEIGIGYLARAGYDPQAQAIFLKSLSAKKAYESKVSGTEYNPNRVDLFASHPATARRVERAAEIASQFSAGGTGFIGEEEYMAAIDGMIYGDSPAQGFVRGKSFVHPELRFSYSVPETFTITNSAERIVAKGPDQSQFILDGGGPAKGRLTDYIVNVWVKQIEREAEIGQLSRVRTYEKNGIVAATADLPFVRGDANWIAQLTLIQHGDGFIRLTGMANRNSTEIIEDLRIAAESFAALSTAEAAEHLPDILRSYLVQEGDSVEALSGSNVSSELFLALNGLEKDADLKPGDIVKTVHR